MKRLKKAKLFWIEVKTQKGIRSIMLGVAFTKGQAQHYRDLRRQYEYWSCKFFSEYL